MKYDAIIIGAGASGLLAANIASQYGNNVLLFDKNEKLGRKLRITGKGRCNVCNNCSNAEVMSNTISNSKFLYSALSQFSPEDTMSYFEDRGVELKTERGNRVYPLSDNANDIADALVNSMGENVTIIRQAVDEVLKENDCIVGVKSNGKIYHSDKVLIATGGASYKATGSTGDGYKFARKLGHTVVEAKASLVGMCSEDERCEKLQGLSLKNCGLKLFKNEKLIYDDFGELIFTHFGISGPIVLSASTKIRDNEKYQVIIDLKPALTMEQLDLRILRDIEEFSSKNFENYLPKLLPKKFISVIIEDSGISAFAKCHSITREQRQKLCNCMKNFKIDITSLRPVNEAIVTAGGVCVKEVNPKTMESKIVNGLYFAGEVLDLDAYTGGFNLQIAFSTANLAGLQLL